MINIEGRVISLELSEHDALQLVALINREVNQTETVWRPYWENMAKKIKLGVEKSVRFQRQLQFERIVRNKRL
jgi:hypothetical protein